MLVYYHFSCSAKWRKLWHLYEGFRRNCCLSLPYRTRSSNIERYRLSIYGSDFEKSPENKIPVPVSEFYRRYFYQRIVHLNILVLYLSYSSSKIVETLMILTINGASFANRHFELLPNDCSKANIKFYDAQTPDDPSTQILPTLCPGEIFIL